MRPVDARHPLVTTSVEAPKRSLPTSVGREREHVRLPSTHTSSHLAVSWPSRCFRVQNMKSTSVYVCEKFLTQQIRVCHGS